MELRKYPRIAQFKDPQALREHLARLGCDLPVDDAIRTAEEGSPLARPIEVLGRKLTNRWCIHPMEGWDGTLDGKPTDLTARRWRNFGLSGAKLIWGGEAVAVRHDGRANPNQLLASRENKSALASLRETLVSAHAERFGSTDDLLVGLQLTHSGRFSKPDPDGKPKPKIAFHHPILDRRLGIQPDDEAVLLSDDEIERIIDAFVDAAKLAYDIGFDFVDIKHCHGYLGHELLAAHTRPGRFGGSFENRTRFLKTIIQRIRSEVPGLGIAVRISAFDTVPYRDDPATRRNGKKGVGVPEPFQHLLPYRYGFAVNPENPLEPDLTETHKLLELLRALDVRLVNISAGSPYYNPHIQRPAYFPPSDGYQPPEDPLAGVARQIRIAKELKQAHPDLIMVGTAYTYLQEFLPHVAQKTVELGWIDFVGLGRMVLPYPDLPVDCLTRGKLDRKRLCRTFSDCTTAPRNGLPSGCYPLDEFYKKTEYAAKLKKIKAADC